MRQTNDDWQSSEQDALIIPTKDGYSVIPMTTLRATRTSNSNQTPETRKTQSTHQINPLIYRLGNIIQFTLLISGMMGLLGYIGWQIGGGIGVIVAILLSIISLVMGNNLKIEKILQLKSALPINSIDGFNLTRMVEKLARKANLKSVPELYINRKNEINAYTLADKDKAAIVLSSHLLSRLSQRELYGVLAHEIAHLKHGDTRLMFFADQVTRLTRYLALAGQVFLIMLFPLVLMNQIIIPWTLLITLFAAPVISQLGLIAISRNREYKADMEAVSLSGDNIGLASALKKIGYQTNLWKRLYAPYMRDVPEILRTHPNTESRINRLERMPLELEDRVVWASSPK